MEQKTFYVSVDGYQFEDPKLCQQYEGLLHKIKKLEEKLESDDDTQENWICSYNLFEFAESWTKTDPIQLIREVEKLKRLTGWMTTEHD